MKNVTTIIITLVSIFTIACAESAPVEGACEGAEAHVDEVEQENATLKSELLETEEELQTAWDESDGLKNVEGVAVAVTPGNPEEFENPEEAYKIKKNEDGTYTLTAFQMSEWWTQFRELENKHVTLKNQMAGLKEVHAAMKNDFFVTSNDLCVTVGLCDYCNEYFGGCSEPVEVQE